MTILPLYPCVFRLVFRLNEPPQAFVQGLSLLYPKPFLEQSSMDKAGKQVLNAKLFRKALILRGRESKAKGIAPFSLLTIWKQTLAVITHRVPLERLTILFDHFDSGKSVIVVTGLDDILVHHSNSVNLKEGLKCKILSVPGAGHGANEQCHMEVNSALDQNIVLAVMGSENAEHGAESSSTASLRLASKL